MELKDWILLIVPIISNGIIIFILEKIFEKRRIVRNTKYEYISIMRRKIDISLNLHAQATKKANENENVSSEEINSLIQQYIDSCLDVYYYHIQNKIIFKSLDDYMERMAVLLKEFSNCIHKDNNGLECSLILNKIRDILMLAKNSCIEF